MQWLRDRALTLTLMAMFLLFLAAQLWTGLSEFNAERQDHDRPAVTLSEYLETGHPYEAIFENWESEFLQMAVFVLLTTVLVQKGSPESRRPGVRSRWISTRVIFGTPPTHRGPSGAAAGCSGSTNTRWGWHSWRCSSFRGWATPLAGSSTTHRIN